MTRANNSITFDIERQLLTEGYEFVAGIDEAGRGALAGPLVVGLVIYNKAFIQNPAKEILSHVRDSKQLSPQNRKKALEYIRQYSLTYSTAVISHQIIDRVNINRATEYAVKQLIRKTLPTPDIIIMDGNFKFDVGIPFTPVIKGDIKSASIASGSIAAKLKRDAIMEKFDLIYPEYHFKKNKGYGTAVHLKAIRHKGPCLIHRKCYEPVKGLININPSEVGI